MKPSASAVIGAVLVGCVGTPAVAFPQRDQATTSRTLAAASRIHARDATAPDTGATCHANSSACGCALCSAARADRAASSR